MLHYQVSPLAGEQKVVRLDRDLGVRDMLV